MSGSVSQDLREDFEDLFENSLCGHLIVDPAGTISRSNWAFAGWLGCSPEVLQHQRFSSLLSIGGKIFYETHLSPLLRMQGSFAEVAVELVSADGSRVPVLLNALERRDQTGAVSFVRLTAYLAKERQTYEQNLLAAVTDAETKLLNARETSELREQFIAVLGHDLRNPLGAITMGTALLAESPGMEARQKMLLQTMAQSARRMNDLIEDVLDFARGRSRWRNETQSRTGGAWLCPASHRRRASAQLTPAEAWWLISNFPTRSNVIPHESPNSSPTCWPMRSPMALRIVPCGSTHRPLPMSCPFPSPIAAKPYRMRCWPPCSSRSHGSLRQRARMVWAWGSILLRKSPEPTAEP